MGWGEQNHLAMEWESASVSGHEKGLYFLGGGDKSLYTHFSHLLKHFVDFARLNGCD